MRLEQWLDKATHGLMPEARVRIEREVRGHIAVGTSDGLAEAEAVKQLGSPRRARRRYMRKYMTVAEYDFLRVTLAKNNPHSIRTRSRLRGNIAMICVTLFLLAVSIIWREESGSLPFTSRFICIYFGLSALVKLAPTMLLRYGVRRTGAIASLVMSLMCIAIYQFVTTLFASANTNIELYSSVLLIGVWVLAILIGLNRLAVLEKNTHLLDDLWHLDHESWNEFEGTREEDPCD